MVDDKFRYMTIWSIIEVECNKKRERQRTRGNEKVRKMTGIEVELDSWPQASHGSVSG